MKIVAEDCDLHRAPPYSCGASGGGAAVGAAGGGAIFGLEAPSVYIAQVASIENAALR